MSGGAAAPRLWAIVPAAGRGTRFTADAQGRAAQPKQYVDLHGRSVLEWSVRAVLGDARVQAIVVVIAADDHRWPAVASNLQSDRLFTAHGGATRQASVLKGLERLAALVRTDDPPVQPDDWILVHDAARPCLSRRDLGALIDVVMPRAPAPQAFPVPVDGASAPVEVVHRQQSGAPVNGAVLGSPLVDTVRRESSARSETLDRQGLWRALTPQIFRFEPLRRALLSAERDGVMVTDEAHALERIGIRSVWVAGSPFNVKVTQAADLQLAAGILTMSEDTHSQIPRIRVGQGMDVHAFGAGDHVVLGGVRIAHPCGIVAHSDGDVVIHALCDAILGALGEGDIGQHFPDTDPRYRGADSRVFLRGVAQRMQAAGLRLINADITVLAEAPRIAAHRGAMAENLAADLTVAAGSINIKATTTEKLGFIGRKDGLAASAVVLLAQALRC